MSDTRADGREIRDDLAPAPEADRLAEMDARAAIASEPVPAQKVEVAEPAPDFGPVNSAGFPIDNVALDAEFARQEAQEPLTTPDVVREPAPVIEREAAPTIEDDIADFEAREARSGLLSPEFARAIGRMVDVAAGVIEDALNSRTSEHVARAVDLMLESVIGYFVPEPELTPMQVHDLTRANAERDESRAVDLAARQDAAELVAVNLDINHNRSPVHGGAGDEVRRGESIYDLYPGLTRDDSGAGEQEREADRGFYDTGIERGR